MLNEQRQGESRAWGPWWSARLPSVSSCLLVSGLGFLAMFPQGIAASEAETSPQVILTLAALAATGSVQAQIRSTAIRPNEDSADATVQDCRIIIQDPWWYVRFTDPERRGWRHTLRGGGNSVEEIEVLGEDQEPVVKKRNDPDAAERRLLRLVRLDFTALQRDFQITATRAATATAPAFQLALIPRDPGWRWQQAILNLDTPGRVSDGRIFEEHGVLRTFLVLSATYGAPVDPVFFQGLPGFP